MTRVISAHAVSVDGFLSGRTPAGTDEFGRGLGDAGMLFDWYFSGEVPSTVFDGFRLSPESARVFDALAARLGAVVVGHTTYVHSSGFGGGSPHPGAAIVVLAHGPVDGIGERQALVTTGIEDAVAAARDLAGGKDVGLMGGGTVTAALAAGLVDEVLLHQVPVLLGAGHRFFDALPAHVDLRLVGAVPAPGVTHLHYEIVR